MTEKDIIYDKTFKKNHSIMVRYCARKVGGYMAEDIAETAEKLRISQVNVRVRLSRVRKRIEEFIEEIL